MNDLAVESEIQWRHFGKVYAALMIFKFSLLSYKKYWGIEKEQFEFYLFLTENKNSD
jgi:hypothetical protein